MSESFNKKLIVITVAVCALLATGTYCFKVVQGDVSVDKLDAFTVGLLFGLLGLLGRTGTQAEMANVPQAVTVENTPDNAVPTEAVKPETATPPTDETPQDDGQSPARKTNAKQKVSR